MLTADEIVHKSYIQTFRALSLEESCSLDVDGKTCIESLLAEAMNSTTKSFPWWFITLLRDIPQHTYKFWHCDITATSQSDSEEAPVHLLLYRRYLH